MDSIIDLHTKAAMAGRNNAQTAQKSPAAPTHRFNLVRFKNVQLATSAAYLVKDIIPREGLVVIWGPPKCGKSFWTFDALMHVALGWQYRGRRVTQGPVVYVACEGERGLGARVAAFKHKHSLTEDPPFFLVPTRLDLAADRDALIADIRAQIGDVKPVAIAIDTLNRSIRGSESSDEDMGNYVKAADAIGDAFACAVPIIHHCGVNDSRPRGHTSLTGAADAQLAVKRETDGTITVKVEWFKDGPEGEIIASKLEVIEVGTDDDGEAITSCVVAETAPPAKSSSRAVTQRQQRALDVLNNTLVDHGKPAPAGPHYPAGARVVSVDLWRENLLAAGVIDKDAANPRQDFKRLKDGLADRDAIREWDGLVWLVNAPASQTRQRKADHA